MPSRELIEARLRLSLAPGLGPILTRRLQSQLGDALAICKASVEQLRTVEGIDRKKADLIRRGIEEADIETEQRLVAEWNVTLVPIDDPLYPPLLRHIVDPPPLLYVRGSIERADSLALAVVGARRCTGYGREQADRLSALCGQAGMTIVSGGAIGIDAAAHRAALRVKARTLAVLGCGLSRCYPPEHAELYEQIADGGGAVISELPMAAPPLPEHFPRRNRIISGLSLGVLVVEASNRSGALITARLAAEEHHREVLALPGRVDSQASAGCHRIIREGWATLVTSPADILDALGEAGQTLKVAMAENAAADQTPGTHAAAPLTCVGSNLTPDQQKVFDAVAAEATEIDAICETSGVPIGSVQSHLMHLQIVGLIERLPANRVRRKR